MVMEKAHICTIPLDYNQCEKISAKCDLCSHKDVCDYCWVSKLWDNENKKRGSDTLLGVCLPIVIKSNMRAGYIISITGKYDFCMFNVPSRPGRKNDYVVISDIYVSDEIRGKSVSKKILNYLMETYDRDIFAKCVRNTSAEHFWQHVGKQIDANADSIDPNHSLYEQKPGKRDLGWYVVENKNKRNIKEQLF